MSMQTIYQHKITKQWVRVKVHKGTWTPTVNYTFALVSDMQKADPIPLDAHNAFRAIRAQCVPWTCDIITTRVITLGNKQEQAE